MPYHFWIVPLVALTLTQIAAITTSVYLHRGLAHRSLRLHPVADAGFRTLLWLTTGQTRREWVAVHRKHHTFTDREGDPHSPRLLGLWRVQVWNVYYYMREARNSETIRTFAPDIGRAGGIACSSRPADQRSRALARSPELRQHGVQLQSAGLGDRWREPAQQPSCAPARREVQHAAVRVRSVMGGDPVPGRGRAGRDRGSAGGATIISLTRAEPACIVPGSGRFTRLPDW